MPRTPQLEGAMPKSRDVGKNVETLKRMHPEMKPKQRVAVAINEAREVGAKIPRKRKK